MQINTSSLRFREAALVLGLALSTVTGQAAATSTPTVALLSDLGAKGDGVADDSLAFQKGADLAARIPGTVLVGETGRVYVIRRGINVGGEFQLDLRGATVKPTGAFSNLFYRPPPATTDFAVTAGLKEGGALLTLKAADGLAPGDLVRVSTKALSGRLVPSYRTVQQVRGSEISLNGPLTYGYPEQSVLQKLTLQGTFAVRDGTVDGAAWTDPNAVVFVGGYANVTIDGLVVTHCTGKTSNWLVPQNNRFVSIKNSHLVDNRITVSGEAINVWDSEQVTVDGNEVRGQGFGISVVRSDHALVQNNVLQGDAMGQPLSTSVRGIKCIACFGATFRANKVSNYVDAIKAEDSGQVLIEGNTVRDVSLGDLTSYAIAISNQNPDRERQGGHRILHNVIVGSGGNGIYLGPGSPRCVVEDNEIRNVGSFGIAIFTESPGEHILRRNTAENFDQAGKGRAGVYLGASALVEDNIISEPSGTKPAIQVGVTAKDSKIGQNRVPRNNPTVRP